MIRAESRLAADESFAKPPASIIMVTCSDGPFCEVTKCLQRVRVVVA